MLLVRFLVRRRVYRQMSPAFESKAANVARKRSGVGVDELVYFETRDSGERLRTLSALEWLHSSVSSHVIQHDSTTVEPPLTEGTLMRPLVSVCPAVDFQATLVLCGMAAGFTDIGASVAVSCHVSVQFLDNGECSWALLASKRSCVGVESFHVLPQPTFAFQFTAADIAHICLIFSKYLGDIS